MSRRWWREREIGIGQLPSGRLLFVEAALDTRVDGISGVVTLVEVASCDQF